MKQYFKTTDIIVFGVSIVCFVWIILYKTIWIDAKSWFYNADRWAEISYTVFASVVASGLFYFITIFIPKFSELKRMIINLPFHIKNIDRLSKILVVHINKGETSEKYTFDEFLSCLNNNNNQTAIDDFITYYMSIKDINFFENAITLQLDFINNIILQYSNLLPKKILVELTELVNITFRTLKVFSNEDKEKLLNQYFLVLKNIIKCNNILKIYLNIK